MTGPEKKNPTKCGLPMKYLAKIWKLVDAKQSAKLTKDQFYIMMHMVMKIRINKVKVPKTTCDLFFF